MFNKLLSFGLIGVLSLGVVSTSVFADDNAGKGSTNDVEIEISSGGLLFETPEIENFKSTEIDKDEIVVNTNFKDDVKIEDYRGTHDGWNIKASASQFERADSQHMLPTGSLTLGEIDEVKSYEKDDNQQPNVVQSDRSIIDGGDDILVIDANEGEGMGQHQFEFEEDALELTLESESAKVGNYKSTLTWTLEASPSNK